MAFFGPESAIGSDILDIGSRKALTKRQRGIGVDLGVPGQFDVPNVPDVRLPVRSASMYLTQYGYICLTYNQPHTSFCTL
jgi:hypothetical protein